MTKLADLQLILLSSAAQREDGSLLPPPDSLGDRSPAIENAIKSLLRRGQASEHEVIDASSAWRHEGEHRIGVAITDAGRAALGIDGKPADASAQELAAPPGNDSPRKESKAAQVLAMLQRSHGATLDDLVTATGWLPHTMRAALTGLRKKGHPLTSEKVDGVRRYRIAQSGAAR